ncbi:9785_t:CDS:2, partial [Scutellospora calospora]
MIKLLEPFEAITRRLSGATYPTLNMVHPYIYTLKQVFALRIEEGETIDSYLDLIYGPLVSEDELENDDNSDSNEQEINQIEYLQPVNTENLIQKVRAAIYLSLDKLWEMPNKSSLTAMILDPRMKNFPFMNEPDRVQQKTQAEFLLRDLYTQLKQEITNKNLEVPYSTMNLINDTEDIFSKMWADNHVQTEDEVT